MNILLLVSLFFFDCNLLPARVDCSNPLDDPSTPSETESYLSSGRLNNLTGSTVTEEPYSGLRCANGDQCSTALRIRRLDSEHERNCACDRECIFYGDCCLDSPWINGSIAMRNTSISCVNIPQLGTGFYMITSCPVTIQNSDLREKCERGGIESDPLASQPVTDIGKRLTYRNIYCAMCHLEVDNLTFWDVALNCIHSGGSQKHKLSPEQIESNLIFDVEQNTWMVNAPLPDGERVIKTCTISPRFPQSVVSALRSCRPGLVESCPAAWEDQSVADECAAYQATRYTDRVGYRNTACARCNEIDVTSLTCSPLKLRSLYPDDVNGRSSIATSSLTILFDINGPDNNVGMKKRCPGQDQRWDRFTSQCRSVSCEFREALLVDGRCITEVVTSVNSTFKVPVGSNESETEEPMDRHFCPMIRLMKDEFTFTVPNQSIGEYGQDSMDSGIIYVPRYNRTFKPTSYRIESDHIFICSDFLNNEISMNKFSSEMGLVTLIGLGISIGSLVLHIIAFALVSDVRNLSGQNLVCLSASLVFAYSSFICMQLMVIRESTILCRITGATVLYFFLASMAWMNVIAWDVCRTLRMATVELRVATGKQRGRFVLYSLYAWTIAGLFTSAALLADHLPPSIIPDSFKPGLGLSSQCWFQRRSALILFFASPVALIMTINLILFVFSTLMIGSTTKGTKSFTQVNTARTNYKLYLKLWLLMGLTWFVGFPASFLESITLWYTFIVLNTLQGLFIFIAFSCKRKILRQVKCKLSYLTLSSSNGGSYSVATLSQNNSKLSSDSDLTMKTSGHLNAAPIQYPSKPHHQPQPSPPAPKQSQSKKSHNFNSPHHQNFHQRQLIQHQNLAAHHLYLRPSNNNANYQRKMSNRH